jgi:hypothetical protein
VFVVVVVIGLHIVGAIQDGREEKRMSSWRKLREGHQATELPKLSREPLRDRHPSESDTTSAQGVFATAGPRHGPGASARGLLVDLPVRDRLLALDEEAVVILVEDSALEIIAGETADRLE